MGFLARATAAVLLAGCYAPDVRDCTLPCATAADCAANQICGEDGLCASPSATATCSAEHGGDAGAVAADSAPDDAPAPGAMIAIHIVIAGDGSVAIGPMMCAAKATGMGSDAGDCMLMAPFGMTATANATPKMDATFTRWTSLVCAAQPATCSFTPVAPITELSVLFTKQN